MKIEIISKEAIKPSSPTPLHLRTFSLSLLDQFIPHFFIPIILYYSNDKSANLTQSQISHLLKNSLSNALKRYYPLAGRTKGDASIDCNDEGVDYLEAQVDCPLSEIVESPRIEVLSRLAPSMNDGMEGASEVQLSIQCNFFNCGGIAIGMWISHRIADACTLSSFLKTWCKMASGEDNLGNPSFVSSSIFPPRDPLGFRPRGEVPEKEIVTKRFYFSDSKIAALKTKLSILAPFMLKPTRVELVTALIWKIGMDRTAAGKYRSTVATQPVNLRARMDPPLLENSFGNIFRTAYAHADCGTDFATLVGKLREGIGKIDGETIRKLQSDGYGMIMENLVKLKELNSNKELQFFRFASWCRFPFYEVDFGLGKPVWVSCAKRASKNGIVLIDSKSGEGIEAWVSMEEEDMREFEQDRELMAFASMS